ALQESHQKKHHLDFYVQLSRAQAKQNRLGPAAESAAAALELAQASGDRDAIAKTRQALIDLHLAKNDFPAALSILESMENAERSSPKQDVRRLASCLRQRGHILLKTARPADAIPALEESMRLAEMAWGPEHVETAHSLSEIGALYRQMGDYARANDALR